MSSEGLGQEWLTLNSRDKGEDNMKKFYTENDGTIKYYLLKFTLDI